MDQTKQRRILLLISFILIGVPFLFDINAAPGSKESVILFSFAFCFAMSFVLTIFTNIQLMYVCGFIVLSEIINIFINLIIKVTLSHPQHFESGSMLAFEILMLIVFTFLITIAGGFLGLLVKRFKENNIRSLLYVFGLSVFAYGLPSWFTKISISSGNLFSPIIIAMILGILFSLLTKLSVNSLTLAVGGGVSLSFIVTILLELRKVPNSHNLWPVEIMVNTGLILAGTYLGCEIPKLISRLKERKNKKLLPE